MVKCRIALTVALLLSGVPGLAAQTSWTDPPTRTAAPSETNAPAQPEVERPKAPASEAVQRQAKRPPARSRAITTFQRRSRVVAQRPSSPVLRSRQAERVSRPKLYRQAILPRRSHPIVVSRPAPHRQAALVRRTHIVTASRPLPPRWSILARRTYSAIGADDVDPWTIRIHPWAGDLDYSGPYGVRRGLCPWMPTRGPSDDEE